MAEIDPEVQPQSFRGLPAGGVEVTVHQIVRAREGSLLSDGMVLHTYTFSGDRVARMDVSQAPTSRTSPSGTANSAPPGEGAGGRCCPLMWP